MAVDVLPCGPRLSWGAAPHGAEIWMNRAWWKPALVGAVCALGATAQTAAAAEELEGAEAEDAPVLAPRAPLTLERVLLSSGGVGYFEYEATVSGDAQLTLDVRADDVDDVLKSIVVFDDQGGMGEVTLPGKAAADEIFRDLPFDPGSLGSEEALLVALRGAEVVVTTADGEHQGRILSVTPEVVQLPDRASTVRHRLAIASNGAVISVILEEATSVRFLDPALQKQIDVALASLLTQKDRGRRTLAIRERGVGNRVVRVGYVVAAPLWKSTYRLTLPADPREKTAQIVGLAVVENQSGAPFRGVDLTLVSGNPVTFRQALYQAYYVDRPEIPVEVVGRVLPRLDEGATGIAEKRERAPHAFGAVDGGEAGAPMPAPFVPQPPVAPPRAESTEAATQVVFHLPAPIDIAAGESALIPILDRKIPAERVSLYQPDVDAHNPIASVMLVNDTETGLPPGVITTFERSASGVVTYLGDARLAPLPAGDRRMVSFGVDQKVRIDRLDRDTQTITLATLSGGTLKLTRTARRTTEYTIAGAAREPRTVIVEHPRLQGFELATPKEGVEITPNYYRIRAEVPAGQTITLAVTLERPIVERVAIADLSAAALEAYATTGELPPAIRAALSRVATLRAAVDEKVAAASAIEAEIAQVTTEQARIRDNLKVVPSGSALAQRYLTTLGEQEDRLAALNTKLSDARRAVDAARKALADAIRGLSG
jgi:hypothetical protein